MTARHPAGYIAAESDLTERDCPPGPLLDQPDARLRPDVWLPWTCQGCGDEDRTGQPEVCPMCGLRNYGGNR